MLSISINLHLNLNLDNSEVFIVLDKNFNNSDSKVVTFKYLAETKKEKFNNYFIENRFGILKGNNVYALDAQNPLIDKCITLLQKNTSNQIQAIVKAASDTLIQNFRSEAQKIIAEMAPVIPTVAASDKTKMSQPQTLIIENHRIPASSEKHSTRRRVEGKTQDRLRTHDSQLKQARQEEIYREEREILRDAFYYNKVLIQQENLARRSI